ncbi:MFS transporter [Ignatzschineria indica]|uniref:MFS transporter n=1 Tax=Ignatzschineria indica TaxID=472583 RepID=UPI002574C182|nr:MFS transporter [Ignatzschineria indica]MDM1544415.1 MFS transporter [Ignatzschineria indica]
MDANNTREVDLQTFIDQHKFSFFQWSIFFICFIIAFLDGYDTVAIGYIAPSLIEEWGIEKPELASVMSAGLFGIAIGAIAFGPIADRIGRKIMLIVSVLVFGIGTLLSAYSQSLDQLTLLRFITGIGLGAAMPNAVTLLSEFCPSEKKFMLVNTMFCGFPVGAASGGFLAAWLIPTFGWESVLFLGGVAPIILTVIMIFYLPESVRYSIAKEKSTLQIRSVLCKISNTAKLYDKFYLIEENTLVDKEGKSGIKIVLSKHFFLGSLLLWVTYFMGLVIFYGVSNWMPTLFVTANINASLAAVVTGLFALGGLGAIANGWLMDRYNPGLLIMIFYLITFVTVGIIGYSVGLSTFLLVSIIVIAGIVMNTAQSSMPSFAANFYPTSGRSTGVSWMLGIGRFGGIFGAYLVAWLIKADISLEHIFIILAIPSLISAAALLLIYKKYGTQ